MNGRPLLPVILPAALLISLAFSLPARAVPVPRLSAGLEPPEVVLGRTAVLTVSVSWEGEAGDLAVSRPEPPSCRGLQVVGSSQRSVAYRDEGKPKQVREFLFTLRGEEEGRGRVGPIRLSYRRPPEAGEHTLATEPLEVPVVSRRAAAGLPFPAGLGAALAAGVLIAVYIRWMVRRYQKKSNEIISDYVENLESRALQELEGARRHRLEGEAEEYCRRMRAVLLDYLEKKAARAGVETAGAASPAPGREEETELTRILERLDEYWFGGTGDDMLQLDEIHRKITVLIKALAQEISESEGEIVA